YYIGIPLNAVGVRWRCIGSDGRDGFVPIGIWGGCDGEFIHWCWLSCDCNFYDQFLFRWCDVARETGTGWCCDWDNVAGCDDNFSFTFSIGKRNGVLVSRWARSSYLEFG